MALVETSVHAMYSNEERALENRIKAYQSAHATTSSELETTKVALSEARKQIAKLEDREATHFRLVLSNRSRSTSRTSCRQGLKRRSEEER